MLKPTTIRIPKEILDQIDEYIRKFRLDRSSYLRKILRKGFEEDKQQRLLQQYINGELSILDLCKELGIGPWEFFDLLKRKNINLSVKFEDFIDSDAYQLEP